ncbi:MAG: formate--tetrahydrofolate ligase [Thermoplasmata archaeon]|nr:MAG: formate--tetrahydrofolate ligase [Thermoplasmata archaeon]
MPLREIIEVAKDAGIGKEYLYPIGRYVAKVSLSLLDDLPRKHGKIVLVTTINPTPAGEGKTTTAIGLAQTLWSMGYKAIVGLREPSIGPFMGMKGGATGGGMACVEPSHEINAHFTGDMYAVSTSHNLLAAMIDNVLHHRKPLNIDPRRILWHRVLDINDRALRNIVIGLGGRSHGVPREDGFDITAASEVMAVLCLSKNYADLKDKLAKMLVAYTYDSEPVFASDLHVVGAMAFLLRNALMPNLVQTSIGSPAFVHGGPFANIAHGTSSIISTLMGARLSEIFVVEAGFGSDLGAEKFFNIVCRAGGFAPSAAILVVTARALKYHGGNGSKNGIRAIERGASNMLKHLENLQVHGVPALVVINKFKGDSEAEISQIKKICESLDVPYAVSEVYSKGVKGGFEMAESLLAVLDKKSRFRPLYPKTLPIKEKIERICTVIYGAKKVVYTLKAEEDLEMAKAVGMEKAPICMAKTPYSLTDDPTIRGRPKNFKITVREVRISSGAGFLVPITGHIMTMPGMPRSPAAEKIDIDDSGNPIIPQ